MPVSVFDGKADYEEYFFLMAEHVLSVRVFELRQMAINIMEHTAATYTNSV